MPSDSENRPVRDPYERATQFRGIDGASESARTLDRLRVYSEDVQYARARCRCYHVETLVRLLAGRASEHLG